MIRLAAECDKVPPEVVSDVQHLKSISGRHISRVSILSMHYLPVRLLIAGATRDVFNSKI
jgi:hypothetical protein